jgi:hypothetical protein
MKLKVYYEEYFTTNWLFDYGHCLPFLIENESFDLTMDINEADVIPILHMWSADEIKQQYEHIKKIYINQVILIMGWTHISEAGSLDKIWDKYKKQFADITDKIYLVHPYTNAEYGIYYDGFWNIQKAIFSDYDKYKVKNAYFINDATEKMYELNPIHKAKGVKKFLSPNRVQLDTPGDRHYKRIALQYILGFEDGYVNDPLKGSIFWPQEPTGEGGVGFSVFHPIHNRYYETSFLSIYVETLTHKTTNAEENEQYRCVTEKTWNPLIKGHFILPYGYCGLIEDIKAYGFLLPDWIDYSYDSIEFDIDRFDAYIRSVKQFLTRSHDELLELFNRDTYILEYNRNLFFERPFDSLYEKIKEL